MAAHIMKFENLENGLKARGEAESTKMLLLKILVHCHIAWDAIPESKEWDIKTWLKLKVF